VKKLLLRLDDTLAGQLEAVARVDRRPITDEIREAIAAHVEARRADPDFQRRLHETMERDRQSYEELCGPSAVISFPVRRLTEA
jgi:hypothetical protein